MGSHSQQDQALRDVQTLLATIKDEIETAGRTVKPAAQVKPDGAVYHVVIARNGIQKYVVTADSELGAMVQLKREIRAIGRK